MRSNPGWYQSEDGLPGTLRYWDGEAWTRHTWTPEVPERKPSYTLRLVATLFVVWFVAVMFYRLVVQR